MKQLPNKKTDVLYIEAGECYEIKPPDPLVAYISKTDKMTIEELDEELESLQRQKSLLESRRAKILAAQ